MTAAFRHQETHHQTALQRRGAFAVVHGGRVRRSSAGVALDCLQTELDAIEDIASKLRDGVTLTGSETSRLRVASLRIREVRGVLRV